MPSDALVNTFGYSNAISLDGLQRPAALPDTVNRNNMINPNLDAGYPSSSDWASGGSVDGGHAIVCDGYGYNAATLYHHLNLGWSGQDTPGTLCPPWTPATILIRCNIKLSITSIQTGTGEIISGRVTDAAAAGLNGATVTATAGVTYWRAKGFDRHHQRQRHLRLSQAALRHHLYRQRQPGRLYLHSPVGDHRDLSPPITSTTTGNRWGMNFVDGVASSVTLNQALDNNG